MPSLPRILAMTLLLVLAALLAVLASPAFSRAHHETVTPRASANETDLIARATPYPPPSRLAVFSQRTALVLACVGVALAVALVFSFAFTPARRGVSQPPFAAVRSEMNTLARLAQNTVAQGAELSRERDVRRRAEEDAQLKQQLLAQSVQEKVRLGHDLHDGIIQSLYAVGLRLESARALIATRPDEAGVHLEQTRTAINTAIHEVRAYIAGLAPEKLRRDGFAQAVASLLAELKAGRDARFDIAIDEHAAALLTADQSLQALQISREAVSNALRHGAATHIQLRLTRAERDVCLEIRDNGTGFDATVGRAGGHGLRNMRARAEWIGATFELESRPAAGTRMVAMIPILQPVEA